MNRRGFLQALFAVPVLVAPLLVPVSVAKPVVTGPLALPRMTYVVTAVDAGRGTITIETADDSGKWSYAGVRPERDLPWADLELAIDAHRFRVGDSVVIG